MKKPLIGLVSSLTVEKEASSSYFAGYKKNSVNFDYINAVSKSGGIPVLLPLLEDKEDIFELVKSLDGILITGGVDIDPTHYNESPKKLLGDICYERDNFEVHLVEAAKELKTPILGICRGIQSLNTFFGGTLYQDISYYNDAFIKHEQNAAPEHGSHKVIIEKDSILNSIFESEIYTNSYHHQFLNKVAENFKVSAYSEDGIVEAIENKNLDDHFIIGFQWHPEMMFKAHDNMKEVFKLFIGKCKK